MKNALILLAGGTGKRLNSKIPKQFLKIGNSNIIEYFLYNLVLTFSMRFYNYFYLRKIFIDLEILV